MEWIGYAIAAIATLGLIGALIVIIYTFILCRNLDEHYSDGYDEYYREDGEKR